MSWFTILIAALNTHLSVTPSAWKISGRGGAVRSVGSKGDSYDNAAAEAVNSLYKKELINFEGPWQGAGDVTVATAEWVSWYNNERLHSACGDIPPAEYEKDWLMGLGNTIIIPEAKAS